MPELKVRGPAQPVTLDEVARAAGVSRATASRALNGGVASAQAVRAVARAAGQLGFVPNRAARMLARNKTDAIALVVAEGPSFIFYNPFLAVLTTTLSASLWKAGYHSMMVFTEPGDPDARISQFLRSGAVDGMIVTNFQRNLEVAVALSGSDVPAVFVGRPPTAAPYVDVDNEEGAYQATRYLVETGRASIACVGGSVLAAPSADRRAGWLRALAECALPPGPYVDGGVDATGGRDAVAKVLAACPHTDAIFAQTDLLAAGVLAGLADAGRSVPDDVAVVGFDNLETATSVFPNLTTVAQPVAALADNAAELMVGYLRDGTWGDFPRILDTQLVVRESA